MGMVQTSGGAIQGTKPDGGTDTAAALAVLLKEHRKRAVETSAAKPLVMAIITDGEPNDENALRKTLVTAANESTSAGDVSFVFLEVGEDNQAASFRLWILKGTESRLTEC